MSDDEVDVREVLSDGFDDGFDDGVDEAASIWLARYSTFGCETNQLQICNWLVISLNWREISSSFSGDTIR